MNLNELKIKIAEVLGVSDTEKELSFEIFIQRTFFVLDAEETLKVPNVGFFQFKTKPFHIGDSIISEDETGVSNTLVFAPSKEDLGNDTQTYLIIDVPHEKKDLFELDESVFSIGVGKPILPVSDEKNGGDAETSYVLLKKSIEERVGEIISESEHLKNFDIWDDHLSMIDSDGENISYGASSTIHKLTDDVEYTEEEIKPGPLKEEKIHPISHEDDDSGEKSSVDSPGDDTISSGIEDEFDVLKNYDDSLEAGFDDKEIIEDNQEFGMIPPELPEDDKINGKTKFWGIEDFKSPDEKKTPENKNDAEEENVDWDWGDDLLGDKDDDINVESFDKDDEPEPGIEEPQDEEAGTNLFIQLEKSLPGEEDNIEKDDEEEIDEETDAEVENILYESQMNSDDEKDDSFKAKYIRSFLILFGSFAVVVILVLLFLSPSEDEPIRRETPPARDDQSTEIVTREPVTTEAEDAVTNEVVSTQDPGENPIEERTRQMQESGSKKTVTPSPRETPPRAAISQGELYRNIPNERSVRGLIFTDGSKYFVQVSSWPTKIKAETEARRLRELGFDAFIVEAYIQKYRSTWYRVKIGDFNSISEAERFLRNNKF